jgi:methionyl-tRNA formyltransferase
VTDQSLFFLGGGHGGIAALRSLQQTFASLEIVSSDADTLGHVRNSDSTRASLDEVQSTHGVMAGYLGILTPSFLRRCTVLNVHYSLLPKYRGLHSVVWAMLNLESELGLTVHVANEFMDDGPVVYQHRINYAGESSWEIMQQCNAHVTATLGGVVADFLAGRIQPTPQDKRDASWVPKRSMDDCFVDFEWPAPRLRALFRALVRPYPLPALSIRGERCEIAAARIVDAPYFCDSGRVVNVDADGAWIKCADSLLVVQRLVNASGAECDSAALLRCGMRLASRKA